MKIKTILGVVSSLCVINSCAWGQSANDYLYLPPSLTDRVVFYDGFELPDAKPEINRMAATIGGSARITADGFAGHGSQSNDQTHGDKPFSVHSARLSADRPITVMRWWRVDKTMQDISGFQLLALLGKGHISCFIRGKGEWCALQRPTMFVQVDHFPSIANVNWAVKDNAYFPPGEWHHVAITVGNGSEISFYLDGAPLVTVHTKGRVFTADDIDTLQGASDSADYSEHPTTTDELVVLDRVLGAQEIGEYYVAARGLQQMKFPPVGSSREDRKSSLRTGVR